MSKKRVKELAFARGVDTTFQDDNPDLRAELSARYDFTGIIGNSAPMRAVYEQIAQVASSNTTVLIGGESGTGKELVAQALHMNSTRARSAFIKVNCGALPEHLIESELFGHERGAFTDAHQRRAGRFERAMGGTLFLDEIGELCASAQVKLLRVLQTREFERLGGVETLRTDARLIVATNRNLEQEMYAGRFRSDLYYRLNIFPISMPALRDRKEDIPLLVENFISKLSGELGEKSVRVSPIAMAWIQEYHWPGNVRELQNALERAVVMAESGVVHHYHLPESIRLSETSDGTTNIGLFEAVAAYEKDLICHSLRETSGNRNPAAKLLGVSERALAYKLRKHGIDHTDFHEE